tara:strand:+ start:534 stop:1133 length:600 start_codon:yes stop_codon:yes gene_type:complete
MTEHAQYNLISAQGFKIMRHIALRLCTALLLSQLLFTGTAQAEGTVIAIVDIKKILNSSSAAKNAGQQIQTMRKEFLAEVKNKESELKKEDSELSKQRSILATDVFEKKRKEFKEKHVAIQRDVQTKRKALDDSLVKTHKIIQDSISTIISKLADEKEFDIAIPKSQALFAKPDLDITQEVLAQLNKELPTITLGKQKP